MKLLLYCTKAKPYLFKKNKKYGLSSENTEYVIMEDFIKTISINGKIVAECDFEVEEIAFNPLTDYKYFFTSTLDEHMLLIKSTLKHKELDDYLKNKIGYAIHIKNLHIFDEPKELSDYMKGNDECLESARMFHNGFFNSKSQFAPTLLRAPQNMMLVSEDGYDKQVLISIRPEWLVEILNGKKTIEVRKKVLKEML